MRIQKLHQAETSAVLYQQLALGLSLLSFRFSDKVSFLFYTTIACGINGYRVGFRGLWSGLSFPEHKIGFIDYNHVYTQLLLDQGSI